MVTLTLCFKWNHLIQFLLSFPYLPRTLELFVESLLTKTLKITSSRNAKTLSTSHMKQCIMSEQRFDFLRELVRNIPDISVAEEAANYHEEDNQSSPEEQYPDSDTPYDLSMPSTSVRAGRQQYSASNGQNGGGHHTQIQQQHHDYQRHYLKRSLSTNPSTVIRHTTTGMVAQVHNDCLPPKLSRSDSSPVPQHLSSSISAAQQHSRLKHQSYSMPTTPIDINNKPNNNPLIQLRTPSQQTAMPAPIVNFDYCSKPVVKIDYSNLPLVSNNVGVTPLSAPANIANMSGNNSAFNFSAEPVINIDLSNIVASATTAVPPVATISIGSPTLAPPPSSTTSSSLSASSSPTNKTKSSLSTAKLAAVEQQSRNSKAAIAEPLNSSSSVTSKATALAAAVAAASTMTTTMSTKKIDSYLEMDEDYDNI